MLLPCSGTIGCALDVDDSSAQHLDHSDGSPSQGTRNSGFIAQNLGMYGINQTPIMRRGRT